nr:MmgE/PrpD family protein [Actinomycetota bacterium]
MSSASSGVAQALAEWAVALAPTEEDLTLAHRSLLDTVAVGIAAREHHILAVAATLGDAGRWAAACHVIDFDDLHMPSTTHISTVCVPVALATDGGQRAYLAGAGVMA